MLKIGDFSKLSRISIRMLRHYNDIGLLIPKTTDKFSGYRYYSEEQLADAIKIIALKDMGFSLATICEILKSYNDHEALAQFLEIKRQETETELSLIEHRLLLLETSIKSLREDDITMNYEITIKTLPKRYVASVRQIIPSYN